MCDMHYASRRDEELAVDKLAFGPAKLPNWTIPALTDIIPDKKSNWLDQT